MPHDDQDHWRELHELLGIPAEKQGPAQPPPTSAPVRATAPLAPPEYREVEPEEAVESLPPQLSELDELPENLDPVDAEMEEELDELPPPGADLDAPPSREESLEEDEGRRRRGRRGRRGRRSRGRRDDAPRDRPLDPADSDLPLEEPVASLARHSDADEFRSPRDRPIVDADDDDELPGLDEEPQDRRDPAPDEDEDTADLFADWNVPSWQEIVGSLYRPER